MKVLGRPLSPAFNVEVLESCGKFMLMYSPNALPHTLETSSNDKDPDTTNGRLLTSEEMLWGRVGLLQYFVGDNQQDDDDDVIEWDGDEDEVDESAL